MIFESRFNLGDRIFTIIKRTTYLECPLCQGLGSVTALIDNEPHEIGCPKCNGSGRIVDPSSPKWIVEEEIQIGINPLTPRVKANFHIKEFVIDETNSYVKIAFPPTTDSRLNRFDLERIARKVKETEIYPTIEEAQAECDRRNRERV